MKAVSGQIEKITPDALLALMGYSPADNTESYDTKISWASQLVGGNVKMAFLLKNLLETISHNPLVFGPFSLFADFQKGGWSKP